VHAVASFPGPNTARANTEAWYLLHNVSGSLPAACLSTPPEPGLQYLCLFPQYLLPYLEASLPLFVSQSMADAAQQGFVMNLGCNPVEPTGPGHCNASQIAYLNNFRVQMLDALQPVLQSKLAGAFLPECSIHVIEDNDGAWTQFVVKNQTQRDTVRAWYMHNTSLLSRVVDGQWGSNPTCKFYTGKSDSAQTTDS
jgi:hypothetical protein